MYVILGCGRVGARVADLLIEAGKSVHLIDSDAGRVEALQERKLTARQGDMLTINLKEEPYASAEAFLLMSGNDERHIAAVKYIKKALPDTPIVVRASNPVSGTSMKEAGANYVVQAADVVGSAVVKELMDLELFKKTDHLVSLIKKTGEGGLGIFLHNSPDPDSISSGLALQKIAEKFKVKSFIYYGGKIGHQQNRTLVNLLGIRMKQIGPADDVQEILKRHGKIAILDCELAGHNNVLPKSHVPDIVIGHHNVAEQNIPGEFVDVRANVGASATILLGYLQELSIVPDPPLATSLLHGIRVDTAGLTRHTSPSDLKAVAYLSPLVDAKLLEQIEAPPMTTETLDVMGRAIQNRLVRSTYLVTNAGFISDRDALPQAAEFLLNLEGVTTTMIFGIQGDTIHISARSRDSRVNVGEILQKAFTSQHAGGHAQAAAGQIPLGILGDTDDKNELLDLVEEVVVKQYLTAAGLTEEEPEDEPDEDERPEPAADAPTNGSSNVKKTKRAKA
jgi:nanoRNase/pAp phosphatase (c-di-AMP/oligoRNAs hydrolase)